MRNRTARGAAYIEGLVAALIMGICMMGAVSLWNFSFNATQRHENTSVAYQLARRNLEAVKQKGFNFAEYTAASPLIYYYDSSGSVEASTAAAGTTAYKVTISVVSDRLDTSTTGATRPNDSALRTVIVTVYNYPGNVEMARMGTLLARSGV
jgi:Tfp pilus assembly protein PilV